MKVLVAVDHPDFARAISEFVVRRLWPAQTQFVVMSVVTSPKVGNVLAVLPGPVLDDLETHLFETAEVLVKNTAQAIKQGCPGHEVSEIVIEGFPKEEIIQYATKNNIELIVVGSHGKSGISRLLLGSVSMAVLNHAPCSVAVIRLPHADKLDERTAELVASKPN